MSVNLDFMLGMLYDVTILTIKENTADMIAFGSLSTFLYPVCLIDDQFVVSRREQDINIL